MTFVQAMAFSKTHAHRTCRDGKAFILQRRHQQLKNAIARAAFTAQSTEAMKVLSEDGYNEITEALRRLGFAGGVESEEDNGRAVSERLHLVLNGIIQFCNYSDRQENPPVLSDDELSQWFQRAAKFAEALQVIINRYLYEIAQVLTMMWNANEKLHPSDESPPRPKRRRIMVVF